MTVGRAFAYWSNYNRHKAIESNPQTKWAVFKWLKLLPLTLEAVETHALGVIKLWGRNCLRNIDWGTDYLCFEFGICIKV